MIWLAGLYDVLYDVLLKALPYRGLPLVGALREAGSRDRRAGGGVLLRRGL
jgi:hypothetical protein